MPATTRTVLRRLLPRSVRNWLRRPGRSLAWARDALAHAAGRDRTIEMRPGWTVRCHPAAWRTAYAAQVLDPAQVEELDAFLAACTPAMTLVDAGAHFGIFSLAALHAGGPGARAVAVDPSPAAVRMLGVEARLNGVQDRLTIVAAAVGAAVGSAELVDAGVLAAGYYVQPEPGHPRRERRVVECVSIDALCERLHLRPTHLKIDVEGFEAEALRGAAETLAGDAPPLVFLELHNAIVRSAGGDAAGAVAALEAAGYELRGCDGRPLARADALAPPLVRLVAIPRRLTGPSPDRP
jgi:FkbM family methyltransferase